MGYYTLRGSVAIASLLSLSLVGGLCVSAGEGPPDPRTSCAEGAPPEGGRDMVLFGQPSRGGATLPEGAVLTLEYGPQGGQHVMIAVRQYSSAVATWIYEVGFEQSPPAAGAAPESPTIDGSNSVPVQTCASGWTETTMPLFIHFNHGAGSPSSGGEASRFRGVLRVVARHRDSEGKLTAEVPVEIQR